MMKISPHQTAPLRIRFCTNCKHAHVRMTPHTDDVKCKLYYTLDLVNGNTRMEDAHEVRQDENKCGLKGKFFEGLTRSDNIK